MIDHGQTGYLAEPFNVESLSAGIRVLLNLDDQEKQRVTCRETAESRFSMKLQARRYHELFRSLVNEMHREAST